MPRSVHNEPTLSKAEHAFMDALDRIVKGEPSHPDLVKKARRGTLKVNVSTVAKEASRSRTLISHEECAYPRVRAAIKAHMAPVLEPRSMAEINKKLRVENAELKRTIRLAREEMVAMIRRMDRVKREADRKTQAALRRERRGSRDANEIAGASTELSIETDNVVRFPNKKKTDK